MVEKPSVGERHYFAKDAMGNVYGLGSGDDGARRAVLYAREWPDAWVGYSQTTTTALHEPKWSKSGSDLKP